MGMPMTHPAVCASEVLFPRSRSTGKERDSESGNDYFEARYYSSAMGRFMSPDPKQVTKQRMFDPQQWNMYSYTRNNPMVAVDPDGRELRFVNQEQANRALRDFRAGVAPSQRSAIQLGTKGGNIILQVNPDAAKAAGDSNLGRLGFVASSDKVAQFQYVDGQTPISATLNGKSGSITLDGNPLSGHSAGGRTLPDSTAPGYVETSQPGVTQVYINNGYEDGAKLEDDAVLAAHEVEAHVYEFFKTGDLTKSDDPALEKNGEIPKVSNEARINARKPDQPNQ